MIRHLLFWLDARLPVCRFWQKNFKQYLVPANLDFWYFLGAVALFILLIMVVTGLVLAVHYRPVADVGSDGVAAAFASLKALVREVPWGGVLRKVHALGASGLFALIYLHLFRGLLYGAYRKPRELVWLFGMALWLLCLIEAFLGRLLPWGQEGYWATTVALNMLSGIPLVGTELTLWLRGGTTVAGPTLARFFVLHVSLVPLLLLLLVVLHLVSVRAVGSGNPEGDGVATTGNCLPYHPYFTVRDGLAIILFLFCFATIVFFVPDSVLSWLGLEPLRPVDALRTPEHIAPPWYFAAFFAMLRSANWTLLGIAPSFWGGLVVLASVVVLALLPWLDASPVSSMRYRGPLSRLSLCLLVLAFLLLTILGRLPVSPLVDALAKGACIYYFAFFLLMPIWTRIDRYRRPSGLEKG